jgi:hypothetical protein
MDGDLDSFIQAYLRQESQLVESTPVWTKEQGGREQGAGSREQGEVGNYFALPAA